MKKFLVLATLGLSASAFAQICEVDMVDRYNRVVQTFRAYGDPTSCMEGMKECRKALRFGPQRGGVDCVRAYSTPTPPTNPYPTPTPTPYPTPGYPSVDATRYLNQGENVIFNNAYYTVVGQAYNGTLALRNSYSGMITQNIRREDIAVTSGCSSQTCVNDSVINLNSSSYSRVMGLTFNGGFILKNEFSGYLSRVDFSAVAVTKGCTYGGYNQVCVGSEVLNSNNSYYQVVAIQPDNRVVLKSNFSGNLVTNIDPRNLIVVR